MLWQAAQVGLVRWVARRSRMVGAFGSGSGTTVSTSGGGAATASQRTASRTYLPRRVGDERSLVA